MTGAYLRIKRNGKWQSIEIEHLTYEERRKNMNYEDALKWLNFMCKWVTDVEKEGYL